MKTKTLFSTLLVLTMLFSALCSCPIAFAKEDAKVATKQVDSDSVDSAEEMVLLDEYGQLEEICTDNSVTMRHEDKSRLYHRGAFVSQTMTVRDENHSFVLSDYDWYKVDYNNGYVLAADIASNLQLNNDALVAAIFVFPAGVKQLSAQETFDVDTDEKHSVQIVYTNGDETVCTKVIVPIAEANFEQLENLSMDWELSKENTDEVSRNLIESFSYEDNFKLRMYNSSAYSLTESQAVARAASYGNYANSKQTVACNAYDTYTNTDSFIKEYVSFYRYNNHKYLSGSAYVGYSDDPIVNIIPRNLFTTRNTYSFIGKEYGFFIKTVQDSGNDNVSSFIVFDIETVVPYPERRNDKPFSVKVVPLFSGVAKYSASANVVLHEVKYANPNLALGNVRVAVSVKNASQKNIGDAGYDAYQDYGYAVGSYAVDANGTGPKKNEKNANAAFVSLTFGLIGNFDGFSGFGIIGTIVGAIDFYSEYIKPSSRSKTSALKGSGTSFSYSGSVIENMNILSMISVYDNLVKGFETRLLNSSQQIEETYPLLYKNNDHCYRVTYGFCQRNSDINWDSIVATYVSLDIFQDNTNLTLGVIQSGKIEQLDSVIGGRIDRYNERPSETQGGTVQEDVFYHTDFIKDNNAGEEAHEEESYVPAAGSYRDFYFTPNRTFRYVIDTFNLSPNTDPYLKIYDSQNNLVTYDDDSGGNGRAKVTVNLTGGQTYKIRTLCHRYKSGAYDFIIRKHESLIGASRTELNPNAVNLQHDSVWFSYVPFYDDFYTFTSVGSTDTYFTLYDNNYKRLAHDDDGGNGRNAKIDMYLKAGKTYYLKVNLYGMNSGSSEIYVNRQKTLIYRPSQYPKFEYKSYSDSAQFFRFTPTETRTYCITTSLDVSGDPYMELFDASWNRLAYNDDGGEGRNAQISYELQAGQTYYIKIRGYNATEERGYIYL